MNTNERELLKAAGCHEFLRLFTLPQAEITRRIQAMSYDAFLNTRYWKLVRHAVMFLRSHHCGQCGRHTLSVDVHHLTYTHHGSEHLHLDDLVLRCGRCHCGEHGIEIESGISAVVRRVLGEVCCG